MRGNRLRIIILAVLLACIVGGRCIWAIRYNANYFASETEATSDCSNVETEDVQNSNSEQASGLGAINDLQIEGSMQSSDTPWGFTAGEFDMEDGTHALLLTPGTAANFSVNTEGKQMLSISWMIHPWVSENSDGVGATVEISADGKAENVTKEFLVEAGEDFEKVDIDISELQTEQVRVNITCNGGAAGNEDADWLIIESIEPKDM